MPLIKLSKNKSCIVDPEDFEILNKFPWHLTASGYAHRWGRKNEEKTIYIHRILLNCPKNMFVDHINRNTLDNRKINLRIVTQRQNVVNTSKRLFTTSIYKGVYWNKQAKKWRSQIQKNKNTALIGYFDNERHAAMAYDIWAKELFGQYASLNFSMF